MGNVASSTAQVEGGVQAMVREGAAAEPVPSGTGSDLHFLRRAGEI
jgi:hypothetical protein